MTIRSTLFLSLAGALIAGAAGPLAGQDSSLVAAKRTMVTRAELQAALSQIEAGTSSSVYSAAIRSNKSADAQVIRKRLTEGDLQVADQIKIDVLGEPGLSATYTVSPSRTIILPGNSEIPVRGVLRSEAQAYFTKEFARFVREPSLTVTTYVRLQLSGAVGKPGFYYVPAASLMTGAIMEPGGGPAGNALYKKSTVKRGDQVIVDGEEFELAVRSGMTLDQLNLQAGDQVDIAAKPSSGLFWRIVGGISALAGVAYLVHTLI